MKLRRRSAIVGAVAGGATWPLAAAPPAGGAANGGANGPSNGSPNGSPNGAPNGDSEPPAHPSAGRWVHAFAAYGQPKYPAGFAHFEYANPQAPRAGTLRLRNPDRRSSFDKYNPFTVRGNAPAGVLIWMFENLVVIAQDEPQTMYGLLAEEIFVAPDFSSVQFRLHPKARFANGDRVTPEDVVHSFTMLSGKGAAPSYQTFYASIERAVAVDSRTVRFDLREKVRDTVFTAGLVPVFSRKWGEGKTLDQIVTEFPVTTGPYVIERADMPRRIEFRFDANYWAKDLGIRRGFFNWERVIYRNYTDQPVAREAFKAGEFDLFKEYGARSWVRQHKGAKWDDGRIVKRSLASGVGQGLQSYQLNLRRPIFQDIRVREALGYTYDFETLNKTGQFKRANSVFNNSEFMAEGLPSPGELALLEPFRAELPPRVFGPAFRAPSTAGDPNGLRRNLLTARTLLTEAGWKLDDSGDLRNAKGDKFEVEYMTPRDGGIDDWQRNLKKLGITLKERVVDFALYTRRLRQYDFDMVTIVEGDFTLPKGGELETIYGSKSADTPGNNNFRGVKSRAADALLAAMSRASTMQQLKDAARAFDRVVMWNFWQVPDLYGSTENISIWNRFEWPAVQAKYLTADTLFGGGIEFGPWPLWTWWLKAEHRNTTPRR
jgi:peptide/nickel transport system substrate-binding protein/microcin C transport system substrate-binding protein